MRNIKLILEYDGVQFHGWQIQPNVRTVQGVLEATLSKLLQHEVNVIGSGRTDTGVHARQFFVHIDLDLESVNFPQDQLVYKLNSILPFDIAVHRIMEVEKDAHARFDATSRTYEYHLGINKNPFLKDLYYQSLLNKEKNKNALFNLGYINMVYKQNYTAAISFFQQALDIDPDYTDALFNLAYSLQLSGDKADARLKYKDLLKRVPNHEGAIRQLNSMD